MTDILTQFIGGLSKDEKMALLAELKRAIAEEMAPAPDDPEKCPRCGCAALTRKGRGPQGGRRWLCGGCGRTFGASTLSVLGASKLDAATWEEFAECTVDAISLREAASRCGVCLSTAWFMRHRLCEAMGARLAAFRSGPGRRCQVDETSFSESLSGNWSRSGAHKMPRRRHRCGQDAGRGYRKTDGVQVICGVNDLGDCFCVLAARAEVSGADVGRALGGRIEPGSVVETDGNRTYDKPLASLGVADHVVRCATGGNHGGLNLINALHSRLKRFMRPFNGVSTRHLQHYLDWFCFTEQFRKSDEDRRRIVYDAACKGTYSTTRREYAQVAIPFSDFWGRSILV